MNASASTAGPRVSRRGTHHPAHRAEDVRRPARVLPWAFATAGATAVAGGLHLAAAATHTESGDLVVGFFGLTGLVQLATAAAVFVLVIGNRDGATRRPALALLLFGTVLTAALLSLYVVVHGTDALAGVLQQSAAGAGAVHSHTAPIEGAASVGTSIPRAEPVDALGTTTVAVELLALTGFLALLPDRLRRRATDVLLVAGILGWGLWLSGLLD